MSSTSSSVLTRCAPSQRSTRFETVRELGSQSMVPEGFSTPGGIERDGVNLAIKGTERRKPDEKSRTGCGR